MDTTLRYVQQFGRSKRDNLKPSLLSKYHVGQTIEVYPFRIMDFGCFSTTDDGLSGLLHNSEMTSELQSNIPEMIEKQVSLQVRINKFDRRTGEIAFSLEGKDKENVATKTEIPSAPVAEAPLTEKPIDTLATPVPVAPVASETTASVLEPYQFKTSQPVITDSTNGSMNDSLSARMEQEMADIQKFLETVLKSSLSSKAKEKLADLLKDTSIFRFTYAMQTCVDEFEPDPGIQLMAAIEVVLQGQQKS